MLIHYTRSYLCIGLIGISALISSCQRNDALGVDLQNRTLSGPAPSYQREDFIVDLENPWDLTLTPDGGIFYTEKCRGLSLREADGTTQFLFGKEGAALQASDFFCEGQSGMHGVALDPEYSSNRRIYVYMPSRLNNPPTNRVIRLTLNSARTQVTNRMDIVTDIPFKHQSNSWGGAGSHSGGRIRFGPDRYLYITTGDNHNGTIPQDLNSLGGKVLRVTADGQGAPGNNTPEGGDPRIFTYGHRNVQGLAFHPQTGDVYVAEHGPGHSDEITLLRPGGNGGWDPKPEEGVSCKDNYCGYTSNKISGIPTLMTDITKFPDAMKPVVHYADSAGMGPLAFIVGSSWKSWNGALAVGIMAEERVDVIQVNSDNEVLGTADMELPKERPRSIVAAPDGRLYISTDSGHIWRITPE